MTTISNSAKFSEKASLTKALLTCGILSSLYYIAINIFVPMQYPGYSAAYHTVSELSAIDAPTRSLWVLMVTFYSPLVIAFGWGIWRTAAKNQKLRVVAILLGIYGISGFFWPPMHQREVLAAGGRSFTDTMHIIFAVATVIMMLLTIRFGAVAFDNWFRYYSAGTILVLVIFGALTAVDSPNIQANLPTPMIGVWERINIGVFMLWVIALAFVLIRKEKNVESLIVHNDKQEERFSGKSQRHSELKETIKDY